jgi:hypothetical protein
VDYGYEEGYEQEDDGYEELGYEADEYGYEEEPVVEIRRPEFFGLGGHDVPQETRQRKERRERVYA